MMIAELSFHLAENQNSGKHSILTSIDIDAAYDSVDQNKLLGMLPRSGLPLWMAQWLKVWVRRRSVRVRMNVGNTYRSRDHPATIGTPTRMG